MPDVTEVGGDFVSLTWNRPKSDGGGKIKGYWIEKKEKDADNWTRVNHTLCITNMINISSLIEDRHYEFRVFAENEAGMSKPSMASNSVKIKDPHGKLKCSNSKNTKVLKTLIKDISNRILLSNIQFNCVYK